MRYKITSFELLKQMVGGLNYNSSLPWTTYPCLLWPRGHNGHGYGCVKVPDGTVEAAHRLAYEFVHGELPTEIEVCHHCDVESCIHLAHLFPGSHLDNMRDMYSKGRRRITFKGEDHPNAKLTEEEITKIGKRFVAGASQHDLATELGVCASTIGNVIYRRTWKELTLSESDSIGIAKALNRKRLGEDVGSAKLTESQVLQIRELGSRGYTQRRIAALFGVAHPTIGMILRGKRWTHI